MFQVSGFPELLPEEKIIEDKIISIIKSSYENSGYVSIETPAVERNSILTSKGGDEVSKQIFGLYGLANGCEDKKDYSLHFDLTVPFARYVLDHRNDLVFPFKRSQIQKVWRGERAQKGRFREFYQADIDVIWNNDKTYEFYNFEIIYVIFLTLKSIFSYFGLSDKFYIHINNKKIIESFFSSLVSNEKVLDLISLVDKKDKISNDKFVLELEKIGLNKEKIDSLLNFISISSLEELKNLSLGDDFDLGVKELYELFSLLKKFSVDEFIKLDLSIMRGLDYYTGIIFETFIDGKESLGSISSGGAYDNFTRFIDQKTNFSGVGGSIGISRLETYIFSQISFDKKTSTDYLLVNFSDNFDEILVLYKRFLDNGKKVELYPQADKLSKQLKYADKKNIPYVVILGEDEIKNGVYQIKNMKTGEKLLQKI